MKNLTRYLILIFFVILTNNTRAEFFEDLSKIIENNEKREFSFQDLPYMS